MSSDTNTSPTMTAAQARALAAEELAVALQTARKLVSYLASDKPYIEEAIELHGAMGPSLVKLAVKSNNAARLSSQETEGEAA